MDMTLEFETLGERCADTTDRPEDLRGMVAFDAHGHRLGEVDDVVVDAATGTSCFLVVESGGLLGMLSVRRLIPIEVVDRVGNALRVHRSAEHVRQDRPIAPGEWRDPDVARQVWAHYSLSVPGSVDVSDRGIA